MQTSGLDSILNGATSAIPGDVISVVDSLALNEGSVIADIHRTDVNTGVAMTELVLFGARGRKSASVVLSEDMGMSETAIARAVFGSQGPDLLRCSSSGVIALDAQQQPLAAAINALGLSHIDWLIEAGGKYLVSGQSEKGQSLCLVSPDGGKDIGLDALDLSDAREITAVQIMGEAVVVAVADPVAGFDVFRFGLDAENDEATVLLSRGAHRFAVNAAVASMTPCASGLLVGTAALSGPSQPVGNWGPELLLITPDGRWDLIVGQPRFSPDGLMLPASTQTPGMGSPVNAAIRAVACRGEEVVLAVQEYAGATLDDRRQARAEFTDYVGAVRLWVSGDLETWEEIPNALPGDIGAVTALCLTEDSVFVGHEGLGADIVPVTRVPR